MKKNILITSSLSFICMFVVQLAFLVGCVSRAEKARNKLEDRGIPYTERAFFDAIREGDMETVTLFLQSNMNSDIQNKHGKTPLCLAAEKGHAEIITALIANGAVVDAKDRNGATPLLHAAYWGRIEAIRALTQAWANLYEHGGPALVAAIMNGMGMTARTLIELGVNPNAKFDFELKHKKFLDNDTIIDLIILSKEPPKPDKLVITALMLAAASDQPVVVRALIEAGAEVTGKEILADSTLFGWNFKKIAGIDAVIKLSHHGFVTSFRSPVSPQPTLSNISAKYGSPHKVTKNTEVIHFYGPIGFVALASDPEKKVQWIVVEVDES